MCNFSSSVVRSSFKITSSALHIHSTYPLSSLSNCCCLLSLRNSCLFSTRSRSFANS
ncbi:hypothetical protein X975_07290, partial [Stegodyphus mimosarum]